MDVCEAIQVEEKKLKKKIYVKCIVEIYFC